MDGPEPVNPVTPALHGSSEGAQPPHDRDAAGTVAPVAGSKNDDSPPGSGGRAASIRRVLILCGDADGNLGDRAIVQAMCETLREAEPSSQPRLTVTCSDAERAKRDYNAATLPTGWRAWPGLWQAARSSSLVICGGGGLFQDDDSLVKMPYWALRVLVARMACSRVAGVSLGVGPLTARFSRFFGRLALRQLEPLSARDPIAQRLASDLADRPVALMPDPALLLKPAPAEQAAAVLAEHGVPQDGRPLIGVAPRRWSPPKRRIVPYSLTWRWRGTSRREKAANHELAAHLARALDDAIERSGGHIVFMPSYNRRHEADEQICLMITEAMRSSAHSILSLDEPSLYKAITARLTVMLGGRMHPTIFAAASGTPVVGLSYNPKFQGFFDMLGLQDQLIDVVDFVNKRRVADLSRALDDAMMGAPGLADRAEALGKHTRDAITRMIRAAE